jgi:hypothetical protein
MMETLTMEMGAQMVVQLSTTMTAQGFLQLALLFAQVQ